MERTDNLPKNTELSRPDRRGEEWRWEGLPDGIWPVPGGRAAPEMAAEIISAMLRTAPVDPGAEEVLDALRPAGTMYCFEKSAAWDFQHRQKFDMLLEELKREIAACRAGYGDALRIFSLLTLSPGFLFEDMERCVNVLAGDPRSFSRFQYEFQSSFPNYTIAVRAMIGGADAVTAATLENSMKGPGG